MAISSNVSGEFTNKVKGLGGYPKRDVDAREAASQPEWSFDGFPTDGTGESEESSTEFASLNQAEKRREYEKVIAI